MGPIRKKKKSARTVVAHSTRPPFRIDVVFLLDSENDADAQYVDVGFDQDIVPLLIAVAYICR